VIIAATGLVMGVLLGLAVFIEFVTQLDDIGAGDYTLIHAVIYSFLKLPNLAYQMMPMAVLLLWGEMWALEKAFEQEDKADPAAAISAKSVRPRNAAAQCICLRGWAIGPNTDSLRVFTAPRKVLSRSLWNSSRAAHKAASSILSYRLIVILRQG
jgi:hypothetical protein